MNLLMTYQNELLGLLAIFIVIIIYLLITKQKKHPSDKEIESQLAQQQQEEEKLETPIETDPTIEEEEHFQLDGNEEGEFIISTKTEEKEPEPIKTTVEKRDVPPHGKISKENFKEFRGARILIAEDNVINQKVIIGLLADSGIEVVIANDGLEALEILEQDNNFTLILMDAHMPRMDGFEATRKIRGNPRYDHIVVIALSGDTAVDDIRKMKEAGMQEHLEKPLNIDALYDIIYAYTKSQNFQIKENPAKELDINEGLEISGNDEAFYNEILKEFLNSYQNTYQEIANYLQKNDIKAVDRHLLDLIGVSANIGAKELTQSAQKLKSALNTNNADSSKELLDFKEKLQNLIQEINNYLSSK